MGSSVGMATFVVAVMGFRVYSFEPVIIPHERSTNGMCEDGYLSKGSKYIEFLLW